MTPREQAMTRVRGLAKVSNEMDQTDKLYSAFKNAETRGLEGSDAFIRTKANLAPGGSSAYGPVQITGTLVQDMMDRGVIPDDLKDYSNRFLDQSKLFLKYGNEKELEGYDPKYDYGGSGHLTTPQDQEDYSKLAKVIIANHYRNAQNQVVQTPGRAGMTGNGPGRNPVHSVIGDWRFGVNSKKGKDNDLRYYNTFMKSYNN
jgi:hypothetical protein